MIAIQCREQLFQRIANHLHPLVPIIVEDKGGVIDCFDKDWIFIMITPEQMSTIKDAFTTNDQYVLGLQSNNPRLIQQNVAETEKYIYLRYCEDTNKHEILYSYSSFIVFREEDK